MRRTSIIALAVILALASQAAAADIAYLAVTDGVWQVWTMDDAGQNQQQVTRSAYDKSRLSWFPDGKRLLVNGNDGLLRVVEIPSGNEQTLSLELSGMLDAMLSPDGQQVAFSLSTSGSVDDNNIWTVNLDGEDLSKRTQLPAMQHEPAWSPDGDRLYFLSGDGGQAHDIWTLTLATGEVSQLTVGALYHFDVAVGPQGALAFSSNRSGNYEIWLWDEMVGGAPQRLTDHPALDARPSWSSSGESIVFESSRSGGLNIWKLELASHELTQLTHHAKGARHPIWAGPTGDEETP